jgi:hypothetical protein
MNKTIKTFEELNVWQNARELVKLVYSFTRQEKFAKDYSLIGQITRAAISIMSNIAEGFERGSNKEFMQFLYLDTFSQLTQRDKSIEDATVQRATVEQIF